MTEKVFNEWLARLEEGVKNYHIHKNNDWLEQMQKGRNALKKIFQEQQKEIEELFESLDIARVGRRDLSNYAKQLKEEIEQLNNKNEQLNIENDWLNGKLTFIQEVLNEKKVKRRS